MGDLTPATRVSAALIVAGSPDLEPDVTRLLGPPEPSSAESRGEALWTRRSLPKDSHELSESALQVLEGANAKVFAEWAADVKVWLEFSVDQSSPLWPNLVVSQVLLQWLATANAGLSFDQVYVGDDPEADDEKAGAAASALYTAWAMPRDAHPGAQLTRKAIRADLAISWAIAQLGDAPLGHTTLVVDYLGAPSWATRGFALSPATVRSLARGTGQLEIRQRFDSLTPQARTEALRARILELAGRPGVTVSEVAAYIGVEHDRVRAVMRELVDEGLVPAGAERNAETSDR